MLRGERQRQLVDAADDIETVRRRDVLRQQAIPDELRHSWNTRPFGIKGDVLACVRLIRLARPRRALDLSLEEVVLQKEGEMFSQGGPDEQLQFVEIEAASLAGRAGAIRGVTSDLLEVEAEVGAERHWRDGGNGQSALQQFDIGR